MSDEMKPGKRAFQRRARRLIGVLCIATVGATSACSGVLDVDMPGQMREEDLLKADLANTLVTSAIADFECALTSYIIGAAGMGNEYFYSTGWTGFIYFSHRQVYPTTGAINTSDCISNTGFGFLRPFQTARMEAEQAYRTIEAFSPQEVPNRDKLLAAAAVYVGFVYTYFGEAWCEVAVDVGPVMTPKETLKRAEEWFSRAIEKGEAAGDHAIAGTPSVVTLARLGRARARLDLGDKTGAAADARLVPQGFVANATRSNITPERRNNIYWHLNLNRYAIIQPAYRNVMVDGVSDPRVPVRFMNQMANDGVSEHWVQLKYTAENSPVPIGKWQEALLILAEAEGGGAAVGHINTLRRHYGLPLYSGTDEGEIQRQIVEERRREFFFEGRRHADMLRYGLPFPEGIGYKGVPYGDATCYPLSQSERDNNPNVR
jgi:hypothetical protein